MRSHPNRGDASLSIHADRVVDASDAAGLHVGALRGDFSDSAHRPDATRPDVHAARTPPRSTHDRDHTRCKCSPIAHNCGSDTAARSSPAPRAILHGRLDNPVRCAHKTQAAVRPHRQHRTEGPGSAAKPPGPSSFAALRIMKRAASAQRADTALAPFGSCRNRRARSSVVSFEKWGAAALNSSVMPPLACGPHHASARAPRPGAHARPRKTFFSEDVVIPDADNAGLRCRTSFDEQRRTHSGERLSPNDGLDRRSQFRYANRRVIC